IRGLLVLGLLAGCGGTVTGEAVEAPASSESALVFCLKFIGGSDYSNEEACYNSYQNGQNHCDTYADGLQGWRHDCKLMSGGDYLYTVSATTCCYDYDEVAPPTAGGLGQPAASDS
ncbi:hypothetical protein, partial [Corallococcus terminator]|uniref:hypothetical protein n=1 Tax=Corallococcus terminator TaxID=2316733 RepID=UPI001ABEF69A